MKLPIAEGVKTPEEVTPGPDQVPHVAGEKSDNVFAIG